MLVSEDHGMLYQVALSDLDVAVYDADILVFVVPYQYIHDVCDKLRGKVKSTAVAVSLVKVRDWLVTTTI